jgi:SAM-dependent methyltransferase
MRWPLKPSPSGEARRMTRRPVYSELAKHYDALFGGVDSVCLDFVQARVPPPATFLDAGCGTGLYAAAFASRGYKVIAADRETDLMSARSASSVTVEFVLADLRRLPFLECFDVILARGVLNDFVERDSLTEALKSLAGALVCDGRLIADVREREAHQRRIARQPVVERKAGGITFRASRSMDKNHTLISREQFVRDGMLSQPFEFKMRTFAEKEVWDLWRAAGFEALTVEHSYGPGSRLTDRLIVVARRIEACSGRSRPATSRRTS